MRNVFLTLAFVLLCVFSFAQKQPTMFTWKKDDLKEIGASDEQITQLLQLTKDSQLRVKAINEDTSLSEDDKKAKVKEEYAARSAERRKILTPEQLKKANQINKERRANQ